MIVSLTHGKHLGMMIARKAKIGHSNLAVDKFPDDELRVQFLFNPKGKRIFLVQSFYGNVSDCIMETILAAKTARELGAKKISLIAPYFPYLRQDKRFRPNEAVSQYIVADMIDGYFDQVFIIDPHLHRTKSLGNIFKTKSVRLTANPLIIEYIKNKMKDPLIIGPDEESFKWAKFVADAVGAECRILKKKRYSSYHVKVELNKKIEIRGRNVVIVDDIISTGHTIMQTCKILRRLGAKNVYCICVHGIFANDALKKLERSQVKVISTNTIPNKASRIDVSEIIADGLNDD